MSEKLTETMRAVQTDCRDDATRTEGMPLTGHNVSEMFGSTLAMLATVARAVELLSEEVAALERTFNARTEHLV